MIRLIFVLFSIFYLTTDFIAQSIPFESEGSNSIFLKQKALGAERENDYLLALTYYNKLLSLYPQNESYQLKNAYYSLITKDYAAAEKGYEALYNAGSTEYNVAFYLGRAKKNLSKYDEAIEILEKLKDDTRKSKEYKSFSKQLKNEMEGAYLAKRAEKIETEFTVKPLNRSINSRQFEGSPEWINEDEFIFATHKDLPLELYDKEKDEPVPNRTIMSAKRSGDQWNALKEFNADYIYSGENFGNAHFNPTRDKFFFTICDKNPKHKIECDIYWSLKDDTGTWSRPTRITGKVNMNGYTATQPTMGYESQKGREVLYFVSDRPGGKGGMDIWYAILSDRKNEFISVRNAGSRINTAGDEMTPHYYLKDSTLFFSSDGHAGIGGLDIFKTKGERVKWTDPENIGKPFNSPADDLYYNPKEGLKEGLLVSNRVGSTPLYGATCCDDIFYFKYEAPVNLFAEIIMVDEETGECLDGEELQFYVHDKYTDDRFLINQFIQKDCEVISVPLNSDLKYSFSSNIDGKASYDLEIDTRNVKKSQTYIDTVVVHQYIPEDVVADVDKTNNRKSRKASQNNSGSGPVIIDPNPLLYGGLESAFYGPVALKDIFYEFDSDRLTPKAIKSIENYLIPFLDAYPDVIIRLMAHTDNVGPETYNLELSQRRAESVVKYLISRGVNRRRLDPRGMGESEPIAPNKNPDGSDNPEGRALNRRTEVQVMGHIGR